jgi:aspartate ammonia-lyase
MKLRLEKDSIGELQVPSDAYYGVQSLRGAQNFRILDQKLNPHFIKNIARIKKAAAEVNFELGDLPREKCDAIVAASDDVISGKLLDSFIVDAIQGGAGTSANMNANEVIANRAIELLGGRKGDYSIVHPNDDVNMAQSTNDVIPTAGKMTVIDLLAPLLCNMAKLRDAFAAKAKEFDGIIKMGRTQMQDAVPIRLGQEFAAYATVTARDIKRIAAAEQEMHSINLGGSAIGTCVNVEPKYLELIAPTLSRVAGYPLQKAEDLIEATQNLDGFACVSSALKTFAVNLSKIANDLRLLSSGPRTGFGEINLPPKQNGSSIMPGKVNPVIPEVVNQVAFLVMGHDLTISTVIEAGQLELNAFEPIIFYNLFQSIDTLGYATETFVDNCVTGITANEERCREHVENSVGIVTTLAPIIGYQQAADIAKKALKQNRPVREVILEDKILSPEEIDRILDPIGMTEPGFIR